MIEATDLRAGVAFVLNNKPYQVIKYSLIKMGRGGATVRVTARNLIDGSVEDKTFSSNLKVDEITPIKRKLNFLYSDSNSVFFLDPSSFEQIEIPFEMVKDKIFYIKEGDSVDVLFWENRPLSIEIPPKVVLRVVDTAPGAKGNSATNVFKPAKLENGLDAKVPLFIDKGDFVKIDTRTGSYVERARDTRDKR